MSTSAVSHAIRGLEERLGVSLFNRTTRSVALTQAGRHLLERLTPALRDVGDALEEMNSFRDTPTGTLRINASRVAAHLLLRRLSRSSSQPIRASIWRSSMTTAWSISWGGGFDAGIRFEEQVPEDMVAVHIGAALRLVVVGTPDYFARHPAPAHPDDLLAHDCIRYRFASGRLYRWEFEKGNAKIEMAVKGRVALGDQDLMVRVALSGHCLAFVFEEIAEKAIADGRLVRVLDDWCPRFPGFTLYYPRQRRVSSALRPSSIWPRPRARRENSAIVPRDACPPSLLFRDPGQGTPFRPCGGSQQRGAADSVGGRSASWRRISRRASSSAAITSSDSRRRGERVLAWGRQILADYNSLREDLSRLRKGMVGTLRLGVIPAAMPSVAFLTARFCKNHPAADVEIQSLNSRAIQRGLDAFELDGGITYLENEPLENVRRIPLYREHYVFVTRREHPLAARDAVTWTEAAAEKLCLLSEDMQNRRIITNLLASIGVAISPSVVGNSFLAIYSHLQHGEWSSIVPHTFSYLFRGTRDLVAIDLIEPLHTQSIGLVLSDREPLSPMAGALLEAVMEGDLGFAFSQPRKT